MPPMEVSGLYQRAVLLTISGKDRYDEPTGVAPVQIACRWVLKRRQSLNAQGDPIVLDGSVDVAIDIRVGSLLFNGTIAQYQATSNPELFEVVGFNSVPDDKCRHITRSVDIIRYANTKPV